MLHIWLFPSSSNLEAAGHYTLLYNVIYVKKITFDLKLNVSLLNNRI